MITLEQIEALMLNATLYKPLHISHLTVEHEVIKDLCTLAKSRLATMPRPIAEAPKDGTNILAFHVPSKMWCIVFWSDFNEWFVITGSFNHVGENEFTHFIPLSELEGE